MEIAKTPKPPYFAVIFTSKLNEDIADYDKVAAQMEELVKQQPGFLGFETARSTTGITVSYWENEAAILNWSDNLEHQEAKRLGKEKFYQSYTIRVCKVERAYAYNNIK